MEHMLAVDVGGSVFAWGTNTLGQCGQQHKCQQILRPSRVRGFGSHGGIYMHV